MTVQLKNGLVLLSGGAIALDDDCCCCDFVVSTSYTTGLITVTVSPTSGTSFTKCNLTIYRNGTLVHSVSNLNAALTYSVSVTAGQTVTATAVAVGNPACSSTSSCTRYSVVIPEVTPCTPFNPAAFTDGSCYTPTEFYAGYQYNPHPITAVVSGLAGPMASLNGTYTVDCEDPVALASVTWDSGASTGSVRITWVGPYAMTASVVSRVPNGSGGFHIGGRDFASDYGTSFKNVTVKSASCGPCTGTLTASYATEGPVLVYGSGTGQPADGVTIAWTFG